jgi:hypothetical protein
MDGNNCLVVQFIRQITGKFNMITFAAADSLKNKVYSLPLLYVAASQLPQVPTSG